METLTMSVADLARALGISRQKAYELARRKDFPSIRLGKRIVIPIEQFKKWFNENANTR